MPSSNKIRILVNSVIFHKLEQGLMTEGMWNDDKSIDIKQIIVLIQLSRL